MYKIIKLSLQSISAILMLGVLALSVMAQRWNFREEFNGRFSKIWTSTNDSLPKENLQPFRPATVSIGGAHDYTFTTVDNAKVIRLNKIFYSMWIRHGMISQEILHGSVGEIEARINTLDVGASNIDGLFDLWLVNAADHSKYVRFGLVNDRTGKIPSWNFSTSTGCYSTDDKGNMPALDFASNNWYRVRIN